MPSPPCGLAASAGSPPAFHSTSLSTASHARIVRSSMKPRSENRSLASPAERPDADVVIYDGNCKICASQVRKLPWWDCCGRLAYVSLHDPLVAERWPDLTHDRLMEEMCIVENRGQGDKGRRHWGPEAVRYLTRRLRRLWWAAPLLYFPGSMLLWRPLYRWIARNRYRLSGFDEREGANCEGDRCRLHR